MPSSRASLVRLPPLERLLARLSTRALTLRSSGPPPAWPARRSGLSSHLAGQAAGVRSAPTLGVMHSAVALVATILPLVAAASEGLVLELEQRLNGSNVEAVNAYLIVNAASALAPFGQRVAACELNAVSLAIQLSRSTNARAAQAHTEALREAVGRCTAFVLALAWPHEVTKFCASVPSWTVGQTVRELRRRMAAIETDELLRTSQNGKSCGAAYLYELQHTRVVLRSAAPVRRSRQRE
jgi:hypothetical protein